MPKMPSGPVKTGRGFTNKDIAAKKKRMDVASGKIRGYTDAQLAAKKKKVTPPKKAAEAGNRSTGSISGQKRYNGPRQTMKPAAGPGPSYTGTGNNVKPRRGYTQAELNAAKKKKAAATMLKTSGYRGAGAVTPKRGYTQAQLNAAKAKKKIVNPRAVKTATRARNRSGGAM